MMKKMKMSVVMVIVVLCGVLIVETRGMAVAVPSFHTMPMPIPYQPIPDQPEPQLPQQPEDDNDLEPNSGVEFEPPVRASWVQISKAPPTTATRVDGSPLELECEARGSPPPTIHWLRDNKPILSQSEEFDNNQVAERSPGLAKVRSRLLINNILPEDKHSYTCVANSGTHTAFSITHVHNTQRTLPKPSNLSEYLLLNREILEAPSKPRIVLYYNIIVQDIGTTLVLPCKVVGHPKPEFYWMDAEDNLITNQSPRVKVLTTGELVIQGLRWADMGGYTCVARNSIAKDSITTFVYPLLSDN